MYRSLSLMFVVTIFGLPLALIGLPYSLYPEWWMLVVTLFIAPFAYTVLFVTTAGVLSLAFQKSIVPGKFPRDLTNPIYRARRLYGLCWTCVFYFKPLYFICLAVPTLKWLTFRLFGYRGQMDFTVYPDTWIRDLPLLKFGKGAYIANRATLGTNMALSNGTIVVDTISVGASATIGHLVMLAPGVVVGDLAEVGAGAAVSLRCRLDEGSLVQPCCAINHLVHIGNGVTVGSMSYVGAATAISAGITIRTGSIVPNRSKIDSQSKADALISSHNSELSVLAMRLRQLEVKLTDSDSSLGSRPGEPQDDPA